MFTMVISYYNVSLKQHVPKARLSREIDFKIATFFRGRAPSFQVRFHSYLLPQLFWRKTLYE